ncbi:hypothetical protein CRG98_002048, partial [Punica granatum]
METWARPMNLSSDQKLGSKGKPVALSSLLISSRCVPPGSELRLCNVHLCRQKCRLRAP